MIWIKRYVGELEYLETMLSRLREDIDQHGEVEDFVQGTKASGSEPQCRYV